MPYDFTDKAAVLLRRVANTGGSLASDLARVAVELALREAYEQGKADASGHTAPQVGAVAKVPDRTIVPAPPAATGDDCTHVWAESFLDGRKVGIRCSRCGVLEQDVQARCSHYFVQQGKHEVCVACRQVRGGNPRS